METFIKSLGINKTGKETANVYTIKIENFDEFSNIYNILDRSNKVDKDSNNSYFNMDETHIEYYNEDYTILLVGNLNDDIYVIQVKNAE